MDRKSKRLSSLKRPNLGDGTPTQSFSKSHRRVSFSNTNCVKEFLVGEDRLTIWGTSYEEEDDNNPAAAAAHLTAALNYTSTTSSGRNAAQPYKPVNVGVSEHDKENIAAKPINETLDFTDQNVTASFDYRSFNQLPDITLNLFEEKKFRFRNDALAENRTSVKPNSPVPAESNISKSIHCSFLNEDDRRMLQGIQPIVDDVDNTVKIDWFHNQLDKIGFDNIDTNSTKVPLAPKVNCDADDMDASIENILQNEKGVENRPSRRDTRRTIVFQEGDDLDLDISPVKSAQHVDSVQKRQTIIPQDDNMNTDSPIDSHQMPISFPLATKVGTQFPAAAPLSSKPRQTILFNNEQVMVEATDMPSVKQSAGEKLSSISASKTSSNTRQTILFNSDEMIDDALSGDKVGAPVPAKQTKDVRKTLVFRAGEDICDMSSALNDQEETEDKQSLGAMGFPVNIFAKEKTLSKPRQTIVFGNENIEDISSKQPSSILGFLKKSRDTQIFTSGDDICDISMMSGESTNTTKGILKNNQASDNPLELGLKRRQTEVFKNDEILEETMCDKNLPVDKERPKLSRQTLVFTSGEEIQDISMEVNIKALDGATTKSPRQQERKTDLPLKSRHTEIFRNDEVLEETMCGKHEKAELQLPRQTEIFPTGENIQEIHMEDCNAHSTEIIAYASNRAAAVKLPVKSRHTELFRNDYILEETLCERQQPIVVQEQRPKQSRQTEIFQTGEDILDVSMQDAAPELPTKSRQSPAKVRHTEIFKNVEIFADTQPETSQPCRTTLIFKSDEDMQDIGMDEKVGNVVEQNVPVETSPVIKSRQTQVFTHDQILEDTICDPVLTKRTFINEPQKSSHHRHTEIFQAGEAIQDICTTEKNTEQRQISKISDSGSIRLSIREMSKIDAPEETMSGKKLGPLLRSRQTQLFAAGENDISTDENNKFANSRMMSASKLDRSVANPLSRSIFEDSQANTTKSILRALGGPLSYSRQTISFQMNEDTCDMSMGKLGNQTRPFGSQSQSTEPNKIPSILEKSSDRPFAQVSMSGGGTKQRQTILFDRSTTMDESTSDVNKCREVEGPVIAAATASRKTQIFPSGDPIPDSSMISSENVGENSSFQFTKPKILETSRAFAVVSSEPSALYRTLIYNNGEDICNMSMLADEHVPLVDNSNQSHASKLETTLPKSGPLRFTAQAEKQQATRTQPPSKKARHTLIFNNEGIAEETSFKEQSAAGHNTLRESVITHSNQKPVIKSESSRRTYVFAKEDIEHDGAAKEEPTKNYTPRRRTLIFQDEEIATEMDESVAQTARDTVLVDNTKSAESLLRSCNPGPISHNKDVRKTLVFATGENIPCESTHTEIAQAQKPFATYQPRKSITFGSDDVHMDQTLGFVPLSDESSRFIEKGPSRYENNSPTTRDIRLFRKRSVNLSRTAPYPATETDMHTANSSAALSANTTAALCNLDPNAITGDGFMADLEKNAMLRKCFKSDYAEVTVDTIRLSPSVWMGEDIDKSHIDLVESFDSTNPEPESPEVIELCEASVMIVNETIGRGPNMTLKESKEQQEALCRKCKNCRLTILNDSTVPNLKLELIKEKKPLLNFDVIKRMQGQPSVRDEFNAIENRRRRLLQSSFQSSFDSACNDEETLLFPEVPSMEFLLENCAAEFRRKLQEENKREYIEPLFPLDQSFNFLFRNRLETENCDWHFNDIYLTVGLLTCYNKTVGSIRIVVRWPGEDMYKPGIGQLEFKKVEITKSPFCRNPSIFEKIVQNQILLTTPSDLMAYCNNSNNLFTFLEDMHKVCDRSHQLMKQLLRTTYANKGSVKCDESGNCIARKVIYSSSETITGRRKIEFRIRIRNIEEICYKDILLPPQSYFKNTVRDLPTGVDFINSFFSNPVQYLRSS